MDQAAVPGAGGDGRWLLVQAAAEPTAVPVADAADAAVGHGDRAGQGPCDCVPGRSACRCPAHQALQQVSRPPALHAPAFLVVSMLAVGCCIGRLVMLSPTWRMSPAGGALHHRIALKDITLVFAPWHFACSCNPARLLLLQLHDSRHGYAS